MSDQHSRDLGRDFARELDQGRGRYEYGPDEVAESIEDAANTTAEYHPGLDREAFHEGARETWTDLHHGPQRSH